MSFSDQTFKTFKYRDNVYDSEKLLAIRGTGVSLTIDLDRLDYSLAFVGAFDESQKKMGTVVMARGEKYEVIAVDREHYDMAMQTDMNGKPRIAKVECKLLSSVVLKKARYVEPEAYREEPRYPPAQPSYQARPSYNRPPLRDVRNGDRNDPPIRHEGAPPRERDVPDQTERRAVRSQYGLPRTNPQRPR